MEKIRLCKFSSEIPDEDLIEIFSFDFFFNGAEYSEV